MPPPPGQDALPGVFPPPFSAGVVVVPIFADTILEATSARVLGVWLLQRRARVLLRVPERQPFSTLSLHPIRRTHALQLNVNASDPVGNEASVVRQRAR